MCRLFYLIKRKEDRCFCWIYSKYNFRDDFWNNPIPRKMSPLMKEILKTKNYIDEVLRFGNDNCVIWIPTHSNSFFVKSALKLVKDGNLRNLKNG